MDGHKWSFNIEISSSSGGGAGGGTRWFSTFLSIKWTQNLARVLSWTSEGSKGDLSFQTSSMYSTMIIDSHMGLPLWIKTGIRLRTGFISRSRGLLCGKSSSTDSYSIPFSANAILTFIAAGLAHESSSFIPAIIKQLPLKIWKFRWLVAFVLL